MRHTLSRIGVLLLVGFLLLFSPISALALDPEDYPMWTQPKTKNAKEWQFEHVNWWKCPYGTWVGGQGYLHAYDGDYSGYIEIENHFKPVGDDEPAILEHIIAINPNETYVAVAAWWGPDYPDDHTRLYEGHLSTSRHYHTFRTWSKRLSEDEIWWKIEDLDEGDTIASGTWEPPVKVGYLYGLCQPTEYWEEGMNAKSYNYIMGFCDTNGLWSTRVNALETGWDEADHMWFTHGHTQYGSTWVHSRYND